MAQELLKDLHENLWGSLRHTFNTDRVLLGVTYLVNFGGFVLLLILFPENMLAGVASIGCLMAVNVLIVLSLRNSKQETLTLVATLAQIYSDNDLGKYFDENKAEYYRRRYSLWLALVPIVMLCAITLALLVKFAGGK